MNDTKSTTSEEAIDVLFLGLVRTPDRFKRSINDLVKMRDEGLVNQIIFSTWDYERGKNPDTFSFLEKNKVKIIESKEPADRGVGNIWCQMMSLEIALKQVDSERFILKNRSDVYIHPEFIRKLITEKKDLLTISKNLPKGNIFKYKVWVHYYELKTPFHMGEECFFGHHHDISLLVNYDASYDSYDVGEARSHIRRLIHPFLKDYPVLYQQLTQYSHHSWIKKMAIQFSKKFFEIRGTKLARQLSSHDKFSRIRKRLNEKTFIDLLAAYYAILYSHFYIDGNSMNDLLIAREWSTPYTSVNPAKFTENFTAEKSHPSQPGQIYLYDMKFLKNACTHNLEKDTISENLMTAIDSFFVQA